MRSYASTAASRRAAEGGSGEPGRARQAVHQHHALPRGRHGAERELRPSRDAARRCADRLRPGDTLRPPQSGGSIVHRPRSLRAVFGARVGAPVCGDAPHGLRGHDDRPAQALSSVAQPDAWPSRVPLDARRGGFDGTARPGPLERRGHGDRRGAPGDAVQPARPRCVRPLHVRARRGRRLHGRRAGRGGLPGRSPPARQTRRTLRLERCDPVGHHVARVHRRRRGALPRVRLARARNCRRHTTYEQSRDRSRRRRRRGISHHSSWSET